jgi:hypothetical protein
MQPIPNTELFQALYLDWFTTTLKKSFFEIRHVPYPNPERTTQQFYRAPTLPPQRGSHHLFFGVNTRKAAGNGKEISHVIAFYADIDNPGPDTWLKIKEFQPRVSAVVSSGRGLHCYWFLERPHPIEPGLLFQNILRGIARELNADNRTISLQQLLRVPGSVNPKNGNYCREIVVDPKVRYEFDEFECFAQQQFQTPEKLQKSPTIITLPNLNHKLVPEKFLQLIDRNKKICKLWSNSVSESFQSGSEADFSLSLALCWRGYKPSEIANILAMSPYPKRTERTISYLSRTIQQAADAVNFAKSKRLAMPKAS